MSLLVYPNGQPIPPAAVAAALKKINPTLGFAWMPPSDIFPKGAWSITVKWHPNDKRHALIARGDMEPGKDYDAIAFLPDDCPPEQAASYVRQKFVRWSGERADAHKLVDKLNSVNEKMAQDNMKPVEEYAEELVKTNAKTLFRNEGKTIPKVFMTDPVGRVKKKGVEL